MLEYLPTLGLFGKLHIGVNVGKYSIHGSSGKLVNIPKQRTGKIHHFSWENLLFRLGPFSIAMLNYQRVKPGKMMEKPGKMEKNSGENGVYSAMLLVSFLCS